MSTDTKIKNLIFNKLTQEQYNNADRVPTEFYLTPDTSIDSSEKGAANGVASLDTNGKVPTEQIPVATTSSLGGVKPDGTTITVTENGTISAVGGSGPSVDLTGYYNRDNLLGADEIEIVPEPVDSGIDNHTLACWHFDGNNENAVDGSVMTSSRTPFDTNGKFGSCAKTPTFTGWMPTSSDDYTWDFWFKTSTITGYDNGQVGGIGNYSSGYKYGCFYKQNEKLYAVRNGDSSIAEQPFATLQENVWTHLALTRQNNIERWFVNGQLIRQGENTYNATSNQAFKSAPSADFDRIDEYRISDIARYTEDFEPPTKPYSVAEPTGKYVVRNKTKLVHKSDIGIANGVAGLDENGKVPVSQLPPSTVQQISSTNLPNASTMAFQFAYLSDKSMLVFSNGVSWQEVVTTDLV